MSEWYPEKGDFFYMQSKPVVHYDTMFGDTLTKPVVTQDRSYSDMVFLCTGQDSTNVVAKVAYGNDWRNGKPYFVRKQFTTFKPVGPEVRTALGLSQEAPVMQESAK